MIRELRRPRRERSFCRWLLWLLVPLTLILLYLILSILTGVCGSRESLYFWRINPGSGSGAIFVTDTEGVRPAHEFAAVNQHGCTGCHAVSSTSHRIAVIAGGGNGQVEVSNLDGSRVNTPQVNASYVAWSPDGKKIALSTDDRKIMILDVASRQLTELKGANEPGSYQEMPSWSPDGSTVAFVRGKVSESSWTFNGPTGIYTIAATGGTATPVQGASEDGFNYYPSYSPNGQWIAFTRHTAGTTTYSAPEAEIFMVPSTGGTPIRLAANDAEDGTSLKNVSNSWPTWSRTGEWLAFNSKRNDDAYDIFITQIDATGHSGPAVAVKSAATPGIFEHLPFWGETPQIDPIPAILALWPCLIPFLLVILAWLLCRWLTAHARPEPPLMAPVRPRPGVLPADKPETFWQVAPTLVIGVGGTGRWVLTLLKKSLYDSGTGKPPAHVRLIAIDTPERERVNQMRDATGQIINIEFGGQALGSDELLLVQQNLETFIKKAYESSDSTLANWFPYGQWETLDAQAHVLANGTGGRRPVARAGLIEQLRFIAPLDASKQGTGAPTNDLTRLWQTLVKSSNDAKDEDAKLVRIIIVGSLAGGMSGTLVDLAYLAGQATKIGLPGYSVHIEGYFATPSTFRTQNVTFPRLQVNTIASMRELQRVQRYQGFPTPMHYRGSETPSVSDARSYLDQALDWRLFNDVTLFGGDGKPERGPGKSSEPWATTFASMADVITFRMDREVNAGTASEYRSNVRGDVTQKQADLDRAVVASAGSFTYRVPIMDILEIVRAQWAFKLLNVFLNGGAGGNSVASNASPSASEGSVSEAAQQFVECNHKAGDPPEGMHAVADVLVTGRALARDIQNLAEPNSSGYTSYLERALGLMLNGEQAAPDAHTKDSLDRHLARIANAIAFTEAVLERLNKARQNLAGQVTGKAENSSDSWFSRLLGMLGLGNSAQHEIQRAVQELMKWEAITGRCLESLKGIETLLIGSAPDQDRPGTHGLYSELEMRQAKAEKRRQEMDKVAVRQYLWSRMIDPEGDPTNARNQYDLVTELYARAEVNLAAYLKQFYWFLAADGTIQLRLVTLEGDEPIVLNDRSPQMVMKMADAISRLALDATKGMAKQLTLESSLPTVFRAPQAEIKFMEGMWRTATPHVAPALQQNEVDGKSIAAIGIPQRVRENPRFHELIEVVLAMGTDRDRVSHTLTPTQVNQIGFSDRTALMLVREDSLMPWTGVPELEEAWQVYARNAGRTKLDQLVEEPINSTVFAAERNVFEYEQRLEDARVVNQDYRLLHPLVALALTRPERTELYALALAAGWVTTEAEKPILRVGNQSFSLESKTATTKLDARIIGLLRVTLAEPEDSEILKALAGNLREPSSETQTAWREFLARYQKGPEQPMRYSDPLPPAPVQPRVCVNGHPMREGLNRCTVCGAPAAAPNQARVCLNGHPMRPGLRFCTECGAPAREPEPTLPPPPVAPPPVRQVWVMPFRDESQAVQDLGAVAALAAYRRLYPNNWESLVMPSRPRRLG